MPRAALPASFTGDLLHGYQEELLSLQLFFTGLATLQYRRLYPANTSARRFCALLDMGATSAHCWGEEAYYLLSFRLTLLASR